MNQSTYTRPLPGMPFPVPGGMSFIAPGAVIPGALPKEKKKKKERPLQKTPLPGTPWLRVKTTEGNVFWTHKERKESVWEVPEEIRELAEQLEREEKEKEAREIESETQQKLADQVRETDDTKRIEREEVERVMEEVKDAVAAGKRKAAEPAEGDTIAGQKKPRVEGGPEGGPEEEPDERWQREIAGEMVAEMEAEAGDSTAKLSLEANDAEQSPIFDEKDSRQESAAPPDTDNGTQLHFKVPNRVDLSLDEAKALFKVSSRDLLCSYTTEGTWHIDPSARKECQPSPSVGYVAPTLH
jgi:transcription elongation regulator 1